jgi:3-dehydroquinate synthetase
MQAAIHFSDFDSTLSDQLFTYINSLVSELTIGNRIALQELNWEVFERALLSDKKGNASDLRFVLPNMNGKLELVSCDRSQRTVDRAKDAVQLALESLATTMQDPL